MREWEKEVQYFGINFWKYSKSKPHSLPLPLPIPLPLYSLWKIFQFKEAITCDTILSTCVCVCVCCVCVPKK